MAIICNILSKLFDYFFAYDQQKYFMLTCLIFIKLLDKLLTIENIKILVINLILMIYIKYYEIVQLHIKLICKNAWNR